jgi:hypothetical protein
MEKQSFRSIAVFMLFFLFPVFTHSPAHAAVVINELLPKTDPATGEWVELFNTGSESVSLDRWHIDHTATDAKSFILNASALIQPHDFLTFSSTQTAISFSIEGDTVRLFDANGTLVDSQNYPGTLGYNTSMGRSSDGAGVWAICTTSTYNMPNNCPQPTPVPTTGVTPTPTAGATPYPTPTPQPKADLPLTETPTPIRLTFGSFLPSPTQTRVLGAQDAVSPTPTPDATSLTVKVDKILAYQILAVAVAWAVIAAVAYVRRK